MDGSNRIARLLREAREKLGLSAEQAAADSGIPLQYVRLLEGDPGVPVGVADEMYLIPFFRRYAAFVGLDEVRLLPEFLAQVQHLHAAPMAPLKLSYGSSITGLWKPAAVVAAVVVAVLLFGRQSLRPPPLDEADWEDLEVQLAARGAEATPVRPSGRVQETAPLSAPDEDPAAAISPPPIAADHSPGPAVPEALASPQLPAQALMGHELRIVANEETWLSIGIDDQPMKSVLLQAGDTRELVANETFTLTLGNAGGVKIMLDNHELPPLGASGQVVRNFRLPRPPTPAGGDQ